MSKPVLTGVAARAAVATMSGFGAGFGLKPGLWESTIVKRVVDGSDKTGQMAATVSRNGALGGALISC